MELSLLCESKLLLCVMDKNEKLTFYASDPETVRMMQEFLYDDNVQKEYYQNEFLKLMPPEKVSKMYKSEQTFKDEIFRNLNERKN